MKKKFRILVTPSSFDLDFIKPKLSKNNYVFVYKKGPINNKKILISYLKDCHGVILGSEILDKEILTSAKELKCIVRFGTATENIDTTFCKLKKIKVYKLPKNLNTKSTAKHAFAMILSLTNNLYNKVVLTKNNNWNRELNFDPVNSKIGIIGMGKIGKAVSNLLTKFGFNVFYFSRRKVKINNKKIKFVNSLNKLISKCNLLSIHLGLNKDTQNFFDKKIFKKMKNKLIVNTSRGNLINENDLYFFLKTNYIKGAALDVYRNEPSCGISLKLRQLKNVISTPHTAFYDKYTIIKMCDISIRKMLDTIK